MQTPYFEFRISLLGVRPMIWRRLRIAESATFWDLHVAIQDVMGWEDYHLHCFRIVDRETRAEVSIGIPDDMDDEFEPGWTLYIRDYFDVLFHPIALYEYDFGDSWLHEVVLERWGDVSANELPACTDGARACPPEDCGGPHMYQEILDALADPKHPNHRVCREQWGASFDPEDFDPKEVEFEDPVERWREAFEEYGESDDGVAETGQTPGEVRQVLRLLKRDPLVAQAIESLGAKAEDSIRYGSLGARFKDERERRGLTIKDVAQRLKVAQYRVKAVEGSDLGSFLPEVQGAYARFLDLENAVAAWALANAEAARRMGIGETDPPTSPRASGPG